MRRAKKVSAKRTSKKEHALSERVSELLEQNIGLKVRLQHSEAERDRGRDRLKEIDNRENIPAYVQNIFHAINRIETAIREVTAFINNPHAQAALREYDENMRRRRENAASLGGLKEIDR